MLTDAAGWLMLPAIDLCGADACLNLESVMWLAVTPWLVRLRLPNLLQIAAGSGVDIGPPWSWWRTLAAAAGEQKGVVVVAASGLLSPAAYGSSAPPPPLPKHNRKPFILVPA